MGDMAEEFKALTRYLKSESSEKRAQNIQKSTQLLIDNEIDFTVHNKNLHLIIESGSHTVDFWPSTGKWNVRGMGAQNNRGIFPLLNFLKKNSVKTEEYDIKYREEVIGSIELKATASWQDMPEELLINGYKYRLEV